MKRNGFTLVELLTVIAIIGILAGMILVSITKARSKGKDAAIQADVVQIMSLAEIFYANNSTYGNGACGTTSLFFQPSTGGCPAAVSGLSTSNYGSAEIIKLLQDAVKQAGSTQPVLNANGNAYAVYVKLKSDTTTFYCADSTGTTKTESVVGGTACQ